MSVLSENSGEEAHHCHLIALHNRVQISTCVSFCLLSLRTGSYNSNQSLLKSPQCTVYGPIDDTACKETQVSILINQDVQISPLGPGNTHPLVVIPRRLLKHEKSMLTQVASMMNGTFRTSLEVGAGESACAHPITSVELRVTFMRDW